MFWKGIRDIFVGWRQGEVYKNGTIMSYGDSRPQGNYGDVHYSPQADSDIGMHYGTFESV